MLVEYNCHRRIKKYLKSTRAHILSLAIAEGVIAVTEDKRTGKKLIVQVANEEFDGGEIVIGKRITKVEGELDINSSLKGLNSLIEDKNKLIVFD